MIRLQRNEFDNAISDLREALNNQPKAPQLLLLMASAYERSGKPELADRQYADATKSSGFDPAVALRYVAFLRGQKNLSQAEDILRDAAARNPRNLQVLSTLADVRLARNNWAGALAVADTVRAAGDSSGLADRIKAAALAGQNKPEASLSALEDAHASAPDAVAPVEALVSTYIRAGKPNKAESLLRDELKKFPSNALLFVLLGQTQLAEAKPDQAENSLKAAIAQQPKDELGYDALSKFYITQKNYDEAKNVIEASLKERPDSLGLRLASASVLIMKGDNEAAIAAYDAILKDQPNSLLAVNNLASLLVENRSDEASLERAAKLAEVLKSSTVPQYQDTVGWVQYKRGNTADAVKSLEAAASKPPNLAAVRYHLGMSYLAAGRKAEAADQFQAALKLEPDGALKEKIQTAMK